MSQPKETLTNAVQNASEQLSTQSVDDAFNRAVSEYEQSAKTTANNIAGQIEGGVKSLTSKAEAFQDKLNNVTAEGLIDDGVQSLENMATGMMDQAVGSLLSKFGASVEIEYTDPDSYGNVFAIESSLVADGGISGTVASLIKLITGLQGGSLKEVADDALSETEKQLKGKINDLGSSLQKQVIDASPSGLLNGVNSINGLVGTSPSSVIRDNVNAAMNEASTSIQTAAASFPTLSTTIEVPDNFGQIGTDSSSTLTYYTGPTTDSAISSALTNLTGGTSSDLNETISSARETKLNLETGASDFENLSGGVSGSEVISSINNTTRSQERYTAVMEEQNQLIRNRVANNGEVGIVQSLNAETLTDVRKQVNDFAPNLQAADVNRVINLAQGNSADQSDAIDLLYQATGKNYNVIRNFIKTIDTTITSATVVKPTDVVFNEPYVIGSYESQWKNGQGDPTFPYINSVEELEAEIKNIQREVTEIVVHWTESPTNKNIGSEEINRYHLKGGLKGIGYHMVIRRDGSIQRGRPINLEGEHAPINDHNKRSIGVVFVGGINVPEGTPNIDDFVSVQSLTRSQFNSFDHICRAFYNRFSGGQVVGHNDIDATENDPGFNVRDYVLARFGKPSKFTDPLTQVPFTQDELNILGTSQNVQFVRTDEYGNAVLQINNSQEETHLDSDSLVKLKSITALKDLD